MLADGAMSYGSLGDGRRFGFSSVEDWFNSIIESFPAPWIIGDDTHYGTEIFDSRGEKILSVWMAWGNPSERQRDGMSDTEWLEYCCDSHWESETQWHIANAIVSARNYLKAHHDRGWIGDDELQRSILRSLIMAYGQWQVNAEIVCGGPDRRMSLREAEQFFDHLKPSKHSEEWGSKKKSEILEKLAKRGPDSGINPEVAESQNRRRAMFAAMWIAHEEFPPQRNGNMVTQILGKEYFERLAVIADEEYDRIKREQEPGAEQ